MANESPYGEKRECLFIGSETDREKKERKKWRRDRERGKGQLASSCYNMGMG